jgi:hypothetical protein
MNIFKLIYEVKRGEREKYLYFNNSFFFKQTYKSFDIIQLLSCKLFVIYSRVTVSSPTV